MQTKTTLCRKSLFIFLTAFFTMSLSFGQTNSSPVFSGEGPGFSDLFQAISPEQITENVFKTVGKDWHCITAGNDSLFNSMTASFGGWGILFSKPATWCMLRADRYTLEIMRKQQTYTMSYFDDQYKSQLLLFGSKSGRNSQKMSETTLTPVKTPQGNISYKEARLIIECKLIEVTTVSPDDYYSEEGRKFVTDAYDEIKKYHKLVFGEITGVWIRK